MLWETLKVEDYFRSQNDPGSQRFEELFVLVVAEKPRKLWDEKWCAVFKGRQETQVTELTEKEWETRGDCKDAI